MLLAFFGVTASARAAEPDTASLIAQLQSGLSCPRAATSIGPSLRYVGDAKVFRVEIRGTTPAGAETAGVSYEVAFNYNDIGSARSLGSEVTFVCRKQSGASCIARPRAEPAASIYALSLSVCDARNAGSIQTASEALLRMNDGVPSAPLPMIWEAPARQPAIAQEAYWLHNESAFTLVAQDTARKFLYRTPSRLMTELGVSPGTLLFDGKRSGFSYSGVAYVFNRNCGAMGYPVTGLVSGDERQVTMSGRAPRRDRDCAVIAYHDEVLTFTRQD